MVGDLEVPLLLAPRSLDRTTWWADKAVWGSVGNLAMTAVGTVVLTLPAAAKETGWLIALGLVVLFAVLSDVSMIFLVHCGVLCGKDDYEQLGKCILGARGATAIRTSLLVLLVGSLTSVNIIVADLVQSNLANFGVGVHWFTSRWVIYLVNLTAMTFFSLIKDVYALRHMSLLAFCSILIVFIAVCTECFSDPQFLEKAAATPPVTLSARTFLTLPVLAMAYLAQFQVLPLYHAMPIESRRHINAVIHISNFGVAMPMYLAFALLPFFVLGPSVSSDFLYTAWPGSKLMTAARIMLAVANILKYPLISLPLRDILLDAWLHVPDVAEGAPNEGEGAERRRSWRLYLPVMVAVHCVVFAGSMFSSDLGQVLDLMGSSTGCLICFVFPSLLYLCRPSTSSTSTTMLGEQEHTQSKMAVTPSNMVAVAMLLSGLLVGSIAFTLTLTLPTL